MPKLLMATRFDMHTVFLVCSALNIVLGLCMLLVQRTRQTYPGFVHWTIGCLGLALALTMFAWSEYLPIPLVTIGGNLLLLLHPGLFGLGLRAFAGRPCRFIPLVIALVLCALASYYYTFVDRNITPRVAVLSFIVVPFHADCAWFVWRNRALRYDLIRPWLSVAFAFYGGWCVLRVGLMFWLEPGNREIWTPSLVQALTMIIFSSVNIAVTVGVIVLNFQRASADLQVREQRLSLAMNATQDAIWEWNLQTNATYHSPRWFEMLGLTATDYNLTMTPAMWNTLCHPDDCEATLAVFRSATKSTASDSYVVEFRMRHGDGSWRWIRGRGRVMERDSHGQPLLMSGTNTDITATVQARERQAKLEAQVQQAGKMQALGTLAGGIAHDFNNILVGIQGNVQLAEADLPADSGIRPLLENAHKACRRARDLVARLMAFNRAGPPSASQSVAIGPLIEEVAALVRATLPSNVTVSRQIDPDCPPLEGHAAEVHELLMNLVVNAAAALGERGGLIEISLQYGPPSPAQRELNPLVRPEPQLQLAVRDNGQGMTPEIRARIFEPFFSTKAPGVGSGIGLTMVHRIVTDLGGAIAVDSTPGHGTQMTLFLPAGRPYLPPDAMTTHPFPTRAQGRVLLVDDEPLVLAVTSEALRRIGLTPETHVSAVEALTSIKSDPEAYVAVLTDLSMPEMSGIQLATEIRRFNVNLSVVIMTGHLTESARTAARELGRVQFVSKPFDLAQLQSLFANFETLKKASTQPAGGVV